MVKPLFFPGGDIGSLAVHGTVNDLAMGGARPLVLSAGFILEEGLPMEDLQRVAVSMAKAAAAAGVAIVTGDTKVVERGKGDGLFVNTTGIGLVPDDVRFSASQAQPGDRVILKRPDRRSWHRDPRQARRAGIRNRDSQRLSAAA